MDDRLCRSTGRCPTSRSGNDFVVLLADTDTTAAVRTAERLRAAIADLRIRGPRGTLTVTASFGIATQATAQDIEEFIARADDALYEAKHTGRNRTCVSQAP